MFDRPGTCRYAACTVGQSDTEYARYIDGGYPFRVTRGFAAPDSPFRFRLRVTIRSRDGGSALRQPRAGVDFLS